MEQMCADLAAEHRDLDALVAELDEDSWRQATPADGWSIADSISHLWFFDQRAAMALSDEAAFAADTERLLAAGGLTEQSVLPGRSITADRLLAEWRDGRRQLLTELAATEPSRRVPWYGPAMGARSFATARLMETWAHGQDIADALGVRRPPTSRLRHVAHIGVTARPFSYRIRGFEVPPVAPFVELHGPGGELWTWGQPGEDRVTGDAEAFCLVVTQRRNVADTSLRASGEAVRWLAIAQAFAGEPGPGRPAIS